MINNRRAVVRCEQYNGLVPTDTVCRKYSSILPCAAATNLFPFLKRRRLVGTYEWTFCTVPHVNLMEWRLS